MPQTPSQPVGPSPAEQQLAQMPAPHDETLAPRLTSAAMKMSPEHMEAKRQRIHELGHGLDDIDRHAWYNVADHASLDDLMATKHSEVTKFVDTFLQVANSAGGQGLPELARIGKNKKGWYTNFARAIFGVMHSPDDAFRFSALLAATSPRTRVERNLSLAMDIWSEWHKDGKPQENIKEWLTNLSNKWTKSKRKVTLADGTIVHQSGTPDFGSYINNVATALEYTGTEWRDLKLMGAGDSYKVNSFYQNLIGNMHEVTLDAWMAKLFGLKQSEFSKGHAYRATKAAMQSVLTTMNKTLAQGEKPWTLSEVQETAWSTLKVVSEAAETQDLSSVVSNLTHGDIARANDFVRLMVKDDGIRQRLKAFGLSKGLDRLTKVYGRIEAKHESTFDRKAASGHETALDRLRTIIETAAKNSNLAKQIADRKREEKVSGEKPRKLAASYTYTPVMAQILDEINAPVPATNAS